MNVEYSKETLELGRESFRNHFNREADPDELKEYIDAFLRLGLAVIE